MSGSGCRVECWVFVLVKGSGFRVSGSGFRVSGSGFRVQSLGFRVEGLERTAAQAPSSSSKRTPAYI